MDSNLISITANGQYWELTRPGWKPLRYLSLEFAVRTAREMARIDRFLTGRSHHVLIDVHAPDLAQALEAAPRGPAAVAPVRDDATVEGGAPVIFLWLGEGEIERVASTELAISRAIQWVLQRIEDIRHPLRDCVAA
jgi:hypothetical protein